MKMLKKKKLPKNFQNTHILEGFENKLNALSKTHVVCVERCIETNETDSLFGYVVRQRHHMFFFL